MLLNSYISPYTRCLAGKVCGLVWSTWGTSQGEDKPGARDKILNTPPPLSFPTPCRSPGGGWGTVTWLTQNFLLQFIVLLCG